MIEKGGVRERRSKQGCASPLLSSLLGPAFNTSFPHPEDEGSSRMKVGVQPSVKMGMFMVTVVLRTCGV
jgi:hypothetical protein